MSGQRVSDEELRNMRRDIEIEDAAAKARGEAHGNYGEDFGALVFDLRDAREALKRVEALEKVAEAGLAWLDTRSQRVLGPDGWDKAINTADDAESRLMAALDALRGGVVHVR